MLVKNISNALLGSLLSLIAAYLLIVAFVLKSEINSFGWSAIHPSDILLGAPFYTLYFIFWILIPLGLLFGFLIPVLVRKKTRRGAVLDGVLTGIVIGLIFASLSALEGTYPPTDSHNEWWLRFGEFASSLPLTIGYSSIWTSAYAFTRAGKASVRGHPLIEP